MISFSHRVLFWPNLLKHRYWRDFEEEGLIARGSFGDVYRTRHRLDGKKCVHNLIFVPSPIPTALCRSWLLNFTTEQMMSCVTFWFAPPFAFRFKEFRFLL